LFILKIVLKVNAYQDIFTVVSAPFFFVLAVIKVGYLWLYVKTFHDVVFKVDECRECGHGIFILRRRGILIFYGSLLIAGTEIHRYRSNGNPEVYAKKPFNAVTRMKG